MVWIIPLKQNTPQPPEPTMRQERTVQASLFDIFAEHEIGRELNAMSQWLDQQRWLLGLIAGDLRRHGIKETGRHGLPAEAVLRCALLKQYRQLSYMELAFHLEDSASFRAFARLPLTWSPKKSVLQQTISAIGAASWEAINRAVLSSARRRKLDDGSVVRIDSTVTASLIHAPTDSSLLWDGVRVMVRLFLPMLERHIAHQDTAPRQTASDGGYASIANLEQAKALGVHDVVFHKKRGIAIEAMAKSRWLYRKLRNFRAGIEANISCLKRAFGLDRCTWRGLAHFQSYVWSSVVAYNLALFARLVLL